MESSNEERAIKEEISSKPTFVDSRQMPHFAKMPRFKLPGRLVRATICSDSFDPNDGGNNSDSDDDDVPIWARFVTSRKQNNKWSEGTCLLDEEKASSKRVGYESLFKREASSAEQGEKGSVIGARTCLIYTVLLGGCVVLGMYFIYVWKHSTSLQRAVHV
jgi:hypothetical protein